MQSSVNKRSGIKKSDNESNVITSSPDFKLQGEIDQNYWFGKNLLTNGVLFLMEEVDQESVFPLVASILEYNLMDPKDRPANLTLFINTPGGLVASAYHLIDSIRHSHIPVHTVGMGQVASAGVMILMSGAKGYRFISQTCSIMSHQYSSGVIGKEHEMVAAVKDVSLESARMMNHYRHCTKKSEKYIRKHLLQHSDCYLTPEEAVTHGIADNILNTY